MHEIDDIMCSPVDFSSDEDNEYVTALKVRKVRLINTGKEKWMATVYRYGITAANSEVLDTKDEAMLKGLQMIKKEIIASERFLGDI